VAAAAVLEAVACGGGGTSGRVDVQAFVPNMDYVISVNPSAAGAPYTIEMRRAP
jgi:hypothetical protein